MAHLAPLVVAVVCLGACADEGAGVPREPFVTDDARALELEGFERIAGEAAAPNVKARRVGDALWVQLTWGLTATADATRHTLALVVMFPSVGAEARGCEGTMVIGRITSEAHRLSAPTTDFATSPHTSCVQVRETAGAFELSLRLATTLQKDVDGTWQRSPVPTVVAVHTTFDSAIESRIPYDGQCEGLQELWFPLAPKYLPVMLYGRNLDSSDFATVENDCRRTGCYETGAGQCGDGDRGVCRYCHDDVCLNADLQSECSPN